jgi:hypothetical protein
MYTPSHAGSIAFTAAFRRFKLEAGKIAGFASEVDAYRESITVVQPVNAEGQEGEIVTLDQVLAGEKSARLRVGGKFAGKKSVTDRLSYLQGEITDARRIMRDCQGRMRDLAGSLADREIAKWEKSQAA